MGLGQNNEWGREMQNWLVPVVLRPHTQRLQLGGFNTDKWHIKVAGPAVATTWGLTQMGQPCLSVVFCSLRLLQPLFVCTDAREILSFAFLSLIAPFAPVLWLLPLPSLLTKSPMGQWQQD